MECALQNLRAQCVEPLIESRGALRIPRRKRVANTCNNAPHFGVRRCCAAFDPRCSYVSAIEKSAIKLRNSKTEHRREACGVRKAYVWLHAKFARTNMTRRLKWSLAGSTTRSTASSARSTRWRRFARNATAGLWDTVLKPTDKFSAASTAPEKPAKRN